MVHDFLIPYSLFLAKSATVLVVLIAVLVLIAGLIREARRGPGGARLQIRHVNQRLRDTRESLDAELLLGETERKKHAKALRTAEKQRRKDDRSGVPRLFVLDFDGDLQASRTEALREEISALLQVARPQDEVLLRLESGGGLVHGYGLAASQLRRIRDSGLKLTVAVDKVAASGGYLMACVAQQIIAAPFAIVGSIGVVGQLPNFSRLLRRHEIDYELHTAGEYKRTLTLFGENNEAARAKFREELEDTHALFKSFVADNRPQLDLARVATGEHWYGTRALANGLVDALKTSDDFVLEKARTAEVFELRWRLRGAWREAVAGRIGRVLARSKQVDSLGHVML